MRRISIVGAGHAGLLAAHGLRLEGHAVTLYTDKSGTDFLERSRPTGIAARFDPALQLERELGLSHWDRVAPEGQGVHLTFCPEPGNRLLTLTARAERPFFAVDLRLQSQRWLGQLEERGGRVVQGAVGLEQLERIAAESDLTLVAVGRGPLQELFRRDPDRSPVDRAQRHLCMMIVRGCAPEFDGVPFRPLKFNLFGSAGEAFWAPFFHKDHGPTWSLLFEARPFGAMDRFRDVTTGAQAVARAKEVIAELMPWDLRWAHQMQLADPNGWLVGSVTPSVRAPVARLPSGRVVAALGETAVTQDPIAGQGANTNSRMVRNLLQCVEAHGAGPYDEAFLTTTFERFWQRDGASACAFSQLLLEPLTRAGRELLLAQYGSNGLGEDGRQALANAIFANFADPALLTDALRDVKAARRLIERYTGRPWFLAVGRGAASIATNQLVRLLGGEPRHPVAPPAPMLAA